MPEGSLGDPLGVMVSLVALGLGGTLSETTLGTQTALQKYWFNSPTELRS